MRRLSARRAALLVLLGALLVRAEEPPAVPLGVTTKGSARQDAPAVYRFDAPSAGLITACVQADGGSDLVLFVCDDDGQPLPDVAGATGQPFPGGRSDGDLLGSRGVEALTLLAPGPGRYLIVVEVVGAPAASFSISAAFAPMPGLARPDDPDGRPNGAPQVEVGGQPRQVEGLLSPADHDLRDWLSLRCQRAGTLRVVVRAPDGDLRLDAHRPGNLRTAVAVSDDDELGVAGNESVSVPVQQGQVVLVRVAAVFAGADKIHYRVIVAVTD